MYSVLIVDDFAIDRQNLADAVRSFNKLPLHIIGVCGKTPMTRWKSSATWRRIF